MHTFKHPPSHPHPLALHTQMKAHQLMSQDPRVKKKMAATTAIARRRMTTTRAALSAITAGVWSVHSGQGPA